jgi:hypothetical protein
MGTSLVAAAIFKYPHSPKSHEIAGCHSPGILEGVAARRKGAFGTYWNDEAGMRDAHRVRAGEGAPRIVAVQRPV